MSLDTLTYTVTAPRRKLNLTFTEDLIAFRAGSPREIVRLQQIPGHGTSVHFFGPGDQAYTGAIRVAEATFTAYLTKHLAIMALERTVGVVNVTPGDDATASARPEEEHEDMYLSAITPRSDPEAGNEFVTIYTLAFLKVRIVGETG